MYIVVLVNIFMIYSFITIIDISKSEYCRAFLNISKISYNIKKVQM